MKTPHFFKVYSRLGVPNLPHRMNDSALGVEDAPDAILTDDFLSQFANAKVSEYTFPKPEDVKSSDYWQILASNLRGCKLKIKEDLKKGEIQIVIGGDNSVTFASVLAVLERFDAGQVGYIQFDAHGEINSYKSSPTKNFHGMYLRPLVLKFDIAEVNELIKAKIPSENLFFIGADDLDIGEEEEFYKNPNIKLFGKDYVKQNFNKVAEELKVFVNGKDHIHINFDIDVMDKSIAPATGIPAMDGFFPEHIFPLLEIIKFHPNWSLDLSEVNPKKEGAEKTVKFAQDVLAFML